MVTVDLEIKQYRKRFFIYAGKSRLSRGFKLEEEAQQELKENHSFYLYWSKSASVSVENTRPVIKYI